jgi:hypothetical protein
MYKIVQVNCSCPSTAISKDRNKSRYNNYCSNRKINEIYNFKKTIAYAEI